MKRVKCPKCDERILFDDAAYEPGRVLVFTCPACNKLFKVRIKPRTPAAAQEAPAPGTLVVIENAFQLRQEIPLRKGLNVIGRYVKGTQANAAITTVDPSIDTTHCKISVRRTPQGDWKFVLTDGPSGTGTFVRDELVQPREQVVLADGDVITIGASTLILRIHPTA